jgi:DNA-binding winged helix-turn-helix (wHTH) protein
MRRSAAAPTDILYRFGPFLVDPVIGRLHHDDEEVAITKKTFAVLLALVERHGQIVEKDELFRVVWPETVVEENNLARCVSMLRKAFRDRSGQEFILTVPGRGYQFCAGLAETIQRAELSTAPIAHEDVNGDAAGDVPSEIDFRSHEWSETRATPPTRRSRSRLLANPHLWRQFVGASITLGVVMTLAYIVYAASAPPALERFWHPLLSARGTLTVCVGPARPATSEHQVVTVSAATTVSRIAGLLQSREKPYDFRPLPSMDFAAVRTQPVIAIGGFNNRWTMKITSGLRFRFMRDETGPGRIVDRDRPQTAGWATRYNGAPSPMTVVEDFAIIARVRDDATGQLVLTAGGIGNHGTAAAGEFLTSPEHMDRFAMNLPPNWETQNIEIVLATSVEEGVSGPPRVIAFHFWN